MTHLRFYSITKLSTLLLVFCCLSSVCISQSGEGIITYNRKTDWTSIMSKLSYLDQAEKDRINLTWGSMDDYEGDKYNLYFKDNKTIYTEKEDEVGTDFSWRKDEFIVLRDLKEKKSKDLREEMGQTFLIEEETPRIKWKILNEIKEIQGYLCMKAETTNKAKGQTIHAWFTDAIPVFGGPEGFGGLPGMILELDINAGDAVITATKLDMETPLDELPFPKKMKGKKITYAELDQKIEKYIAESIEGRKNPFWRLRY